MLEGRLFHKLPDERALYHEEEAIMAMNHAAEKQFAVEEARRLLQGLPIACEEFGRAVERVLEAATPVTGHTLRDLIVQEAMAEWMVGSGYC